MLEKFEKDEPGRRRANLTTGFALCRMTAANVGVRLMPNDSSKRSKKQNSMNRQVSRPAAKENTETRKKSEWIGEQLRSIYDETLTEPVPERLTELLRELEEKSGSK